MESGSQPSQAQSQQARASNPNRSTTGLSSWGLMNGARQAPRTASSIWSNNPLTDNLSSRDSTSASASAQRPNPLGSAEGGSNLWSRPAPTSWNSSDSQQFRSTASRSTSPPNPLQTASNSSPSFNPSRSAAQQNTNFPSTSFMTTYASYADSTQGDGGGHGFQSYIGFQRGAQGLSSGFDERDQVPPSRHSESEAPFVGDSAAFANGLGSHSRHPSRMSLSGATASFAQQQPGSRSQSYSQHSNQAALENIHAHLMRDNIQTATTSPGPRPSVVPAGTPASSQLGGWRDFTPGSALNLANGNLQEPRRDSLANSVHNSALNSPRNFSAQRQADPWTPSASVPLDFEVLTRLQRSQGQMPRQATQSPYLDQSSYLPYTDIQTQLIQMHSGYPLPFQQFQNYGYQTGQQLFPPTGPAGMIPRGRPADLTVGVRCQELEEFRRSSKSNRKWELKNVFGRVVEFAGDQQGSRFLQEKIPTANSDDRQRVFDEIMVDANALMVDVFGNYVVQQLFEHGTMVQKKLLAAKMKGHVAQLSAQLYGCRCVQEALEYVLVEQQVELAKELEPDIIRIMKSENGNHVVQKVLTKLPRDRIDFVYDAVRGRIFELSQQQYACRVIQRMIEKGTAADKAFILQEFHEVAHRLVTDNWGNYVVQAVIRQGGPEARGKVIRLCIDQFLMFSKQKVASNVMEHCIEYGTEQDRLEMFRLITRQADDGSSLLQAMWKDNFANYVVQKLCHCLKGEEQAVLVKESKPYFESRKKPSRPDDKWISFEKLISQFSAPPSRQGSVSSIGGGLNGASGSRPQSQSGSAMPTPDLTTGGNSPRTSSSQDTNEASLERSERYLADQFSKTSLSVEQEQLS